MTRAELLRGAELLLEERDRHLHRYRRAHRLELLRGPLFLIGLALVVWCSPIGREPSWWWIGLITGWCFIAAAAHLASSLWAIHELLEAERLLARAHEKLMEQPE